MHGGEQPGGPAISSLGVFNEGCCVNAREKWLQIIADIVEYELCADQGQLLSEEADRWIERSPVLARGIILGVGAALTLHLANAIPPKWDVISKGFFLWGRIRNY
ncbi:hypothetical protein OPTIMUS_159 [Mycobacterium phage Optimus]|uniref:Uncharacterized protein n=1 Tax=Mycobacterium phage Optimus TaxID=2922218 RepID=G1DAU8_9CAUD|nr:hypothetical protein N860_gp157 [Mycobacterium phage Redno2]YP_009591015.1 hypothetical protein FDG54_gp159 [Mycobacterium phage Optimus]AWH13974.1 hypothetical protein SEA_HALLEY_164 [Mycobacterium phage Halley]AXQ52154.1 hypothetical protein SEA_EJIMIX_154 [Mycobacterium phage Ejimix]QBJ00111.1 hypothetical protein SEA_PHOEBUS_164 [Mycobacterium phage Phoebus]QZD98035.1 hypothetical protein SEA_BEEM_164 [Mycobacterium phage Beem]AEJ92215.1 hypothetical protein OPTIMUS_159 [Mycobacterium 